MQLFLKMTSGTRERCVQKYAEELVQGSCAMRASRLAPRRRRQRNIAMLSSQILGVGHIKGGTLPTIPHGDDAVEHGMWVRAEDGSGRARLERVHVVAGGGGEEHDLSRSHEGRRLE